MNAITAIAANSVIKWCVGLTAKTDTAEEMASESELEAASLEPKEELEPPFQGPGYGAPGSPIGRQRAVEHSNWISTLSAPQARVADAKLIGLIYVNFYKKMHSGSGQSWFTFIFALPTRGLNTHHHTSSNACFCCAFCWPGRLRLLLPDPTSSSISIAIP